jgi:hypothetical protein
MRLPTGTAFFAAAGEFVHGGPGAGFRSFHAGTTLLVAGFDMSCLPFLFVGVTGFIALGHGGVYVGQFTGRSSIHGKADFEGHLPVMHFSIFDAAARFDHLKPAQVLNGFMRPFNGRGNGILHGSGGGAGEFDEFIDGVFHIECLVFSPLISSGFMSVGFGVAIPLTENVYWRARLNRRGGRANKVNAAHAHAIRQAATATSTDQILGSMSAASPIWLAGTMGCSPQLHRSG